MKKFSRLLISLLLFSLCTISVYARAGGGSGGSGGHSHHSSHGSHFSHRHNTHSTFSELFSFLQFGLACFAMNAIKNRHLISARIKTKNNIKKK